MAAVSGAYLPEHPYAAWLAAEKRFSTLAGAHGAWAGALALARAESAPPSLVWRLEEARDRCLSNVEEASEACMLAHRECAEFRGRGPTTAQKGVSRS